MQAEPVASAEAAGWGHGRPRAGSEEEATLDIVERGVVSMGPIRVIRALWFSVAWFVVAMIVVVILAFVPVSGTPVMEGAPATASRPAIRPNFTESCPSLAHMLVAPLATYVPTASASLNQEGCADGATGRLLAIVLLFAVGIAPLGLAMMAALCLGPPSGRSGRRGPRSGTQSLTLPTSAEVFRSACTTSLYTRSSPGGATNLGGS